MNFLSLRAGIYKFVVTFKERTSSEYMFYNFAVTVEENKEVQAIELISPVRESTSFGVCIENPTNEDVKITKSMFTFNNEYLDITPEEFIVKAHDPREFQINFRPLIVSEQTSELVLKNPVLGEFQYSLQLKGIASLG